VLGIVNTEAPTLRYQLFHRTAAALFEAERYRAKNALMLVHSFSPRDASLDDFLRFASAMNVVGAGKNRVSEFRRFGEIDLCLGWVSDAVSQ
jgi:hypothetical protein